jgi:predicted nucleotidyltransferase component of viral defense system
MMKNAYIDTVRLLLDISPDVFNSGVFALKGGTAINLFLQDMPRLSVDLDLVYVDHETPCEKALDLINATLNSAAERLESRGMQCQRGASAEETKLFIESNQVRLKIEANHVFRGSLLPAVSMPLCEKAQNLFFTDIELPLLQSHEIYGSKLVAAMDRQHPRDLFDVLAMYDSVGLTPDTPAPRAGAEYVLRDVRNDGLPSTAACVISSRWKRSSSN